MRDTMETRDDMDVAVNDESIDTETLSEAVTEAMERNAIDDTVTIGGDIAA